MELYAQRSTPVFGPVWCVLRGATAVEAAQMVQHHRRKSLDLADVIRNDGVGGSNPSCGTSYKAPKTRHKLTLWRFGAVRVFGDSHDFSHAARGCCRCNKEVGGSILPGSTTRFRRQNGRFCGFPAAFP
jgi:hypothetical protein